MGKKITLDPFKTELAVELARVGVPLREIEKRFGGHYEKYSHLKEKVSCNGCKRLLNELSLEELKALKTLLKFVPPRLIARWLDLCFRFRRCPQAQKKPLSRGTKTRTGKGAECL